VGGPVVPGMLKQGWEARSGKEAADGTPYVSATPMLLYHH